MSRRLSIVTDEVGVRQALTEIIDNTNQANAGGLFKATINKLQWDSVKTSLRENVTRLTNSELKDEDRNNLVEACKYLCYRAAELINLTDVNATTRIAGGSVFGKKVNTRLYHVNKLIPYYNLCMEADSILAKLQDGVDALARWIEDFFTVSSESAPKLHQQPPARHRVDLVMVNAAKARAAKRRSDNEHDPSRHQVDHAEVEAATARAAKRRGNHEGYPLIPINESRHDERRGCFSCFGKK